MSLGPGKRVHVLIRPAQYDRLVARARSSGRSMGSLIREAIESDLGRGAPASATERDGGAGRRLLAAGTIAGARRDAGSGPDSGIDLGADR